MRERLSFCLGLLLSFSAILFVPVAAAEEGIPLTLALSPTVGIPIGVDAAFYSLGGGAQVSAAYRMPFLPLLTAGGAFSFAYVPLKSFTSLSFIGGGLSAGLSWDLLPSLNVHASGTGGYYLGFLNDGSGMSGSNPFVAASGGLSWAVLQPWSLDFEVFYRNYLGLYSEFGAAVGLSFDLQDAARRRTMNLNLQPEPLQALEVGALSLQDVFPIFYTFYDRNPIGSVTLRNTSKETVTDVVVSLVIRQYMDAPKECARIPEIKAGAEVSVDLFALFRNDILDIMQATKSAAELSVNYEVKDRAGTLTKTETIRVYDRNAMRWDDDNKAAAFVMYRDSEVLTFSNNVNSIIKDKLNRAIDRNLQAAIGIHDGLRALKISYVKNPLTPYEVVSKDQQAVDALKFPRQTLEHRAGDCSDLSILYCALLESLQIETAFITIPGHIYMAFALETPPEAAKRMLSSVVPDLIFSGGKAWVPVEVTERDKTFLAAWQLGAKEWREHTALNQAKMHLVREAWTTYEPANFTETTGKVPAVPSTEVLKAFQDDLVTLVDREIFSRVVVLQAEVTKSKSDPKAVNALGVLYANYDKRVEAEREFIKALSKGEYVPALVNLGNINYLNGNMEKAYTFYERAYKKEPKNVTVLLNLARAAYELENYYQSNKAYDELLMLNSELAERFAYLKLKGDDSGLRAAGVQQLKEEMVWSE